jgi:hypothetical protein
MEILIGWFVSYLMGAGWLYIGIFAFAFLFPRLFRVLYWMLMMPVMAFGSTPFIWAFLGFFMGWGGGTLNFSLAIGTTFAFLFCLWSDPKKTEG